MAKLTLGVVGTSRKENERRLAIHPEHVKRIDADLRERIVLERGYGERFGVPDSQLEPLVGGLQPRDELVANSSVVLLPKPTRQDVAQLREGQVLWGWPHCVQDSTLTQLAIDQKLTLLAWEAMNRWGSDGTFGVHVFHKNNELAGYCSVLHAFQLLGLTGHYGRRRRAAVISFGATARGAVTALNGLGVTDVTVLTQREVTAVTSPIPTVVLGQFERTEGDASSTQVLTKDGATPMAEFLAKQDVVVNCVLQDTDAPLMFVTNEDLRLFASGNLVVDVSCDDGMGFEFARPTPFTDPMLTVGDGVHYYGVDHSPSYLWDASTWEISEALIPYLRTVMEGPDSWDAEETISRAIEIRDGVVRNPKILSFQQRSGDYPHARI
jgi:alanine dehydrogenase